MNDIQDGVTSAPWGASPPDPGISDNWNVWEVMEDDPPIIECINWHCEPNAKFVAYARTLVPVQAAIISHLISAMAELKTMAFDNNQLDMLEKIEDVEGIVTPLAENVLPPKYLRSDTFLLPPTIE